MLSNISKSNRKFWNINNDSLINNYLYINVGYCNKYTHKMGVLILILNYYAEKALLKDKHTEIGEIAS